MCSLRILCVAKTDVFPKVLTFNKKLCDSVSVVRRALVGSISIGDEESS